MHIAYRKRPHSPRPRKVVLFISPDSLFARASADRAAVFVNSSIVIHLSVFVPCGIQAFFLIIAENAAGREAFFPFYINLGGSAG